MTAFGNNNGFLLVPHDINDGEPLCSTGVFQW